MRINLARPPRSTAPTLPWYMPFQLAVGLLMAAAAPGVYGTYLLRRHQILIGILVLVVWGVPFAFLLRLAHRRKWARVWLTLPATVAFSVLGAWVFA